MYESSGGERRGWVREGGIVVAAGGAALGPHDGTAAGDGVECFGLTVK